MCKAGPLSWHWDINLKETKAWILLFNNITDFWPGMSTAVVADSCSLIFTILYSSSLQPKGQSIHLICNESRHFTTPSDGTFPCRGMWPSSFICNRKSDKMLTRLLS